MSKNLETTRNIIEKLYDYLKNNIDRLRNRNGFIIDVKLYKVVDLRDEIVREWYTR